jgi:hypothetical protein
MSVAVDLAFPGQRQPETDVRVDPFVDTATFEKGKVDFIFYVQGDWALTAGPWLRANSTCILHINDCEHCQSDRRCHDQGPGSLELTWSDWQCGC